MQDLKEIIWSTPCHIWFSSSWCRFKLAHNQHHSHQVTFFAQKFLGLNTHLSYHLGWWGVLRGIYRRRWEVCLLSKLPLPGMNQTQVTTYTSNFWKKWSNSWNGIDLDEGVPHVIIYFQNRCHVTCSNKYQDQPHLLLTNWTHLFMSFVRHWM